MKGVDMTFLEQLLAKRKKQKQKEAFSEKASTMREKLSLKVKAAEREQLKAKKLAEKTKRRIEHSKKTGVPAEILLQPTQTMTRTTPTGTTVSTYTAPPVVPERIQKAMAEMPTMPGFGKIAILGGIGLMGLYFITRKKKR